jgi:hypothetical protein
LTSPILITFGKNSIYEAPKRILYDQIKGKCLRKARKKISEVDINFGD